MTATLAGKDTAVFERDGYVYLVSTVGPFEPAESEIEAYSFSQELRQMAPNPHLLWLHGTYAEAGRPIDHGTHSLEWEAEDLSIKSLTPVFCPVTVMHDPRTAVGLIADTKLIPGSGEGPTRIDNTLAVWAHRFPEVAEEISANHKRRTLMQSQECRPAYWECGGCGQRFLEKRLIESHQSQEHSALNRKPTRKLGNVTFTGTGLIFGTRGVKGALASAQLDVLADEVSEFHEQSRSGKSAPTRRTSKVEIEQKDYEALIQKAGKVDDLSARLRTAEEGSAKVGELEKQVEKLEIEKQALSTERDTEKSKREQLEEQSRASTLAGDRMGKLGTGFTGKLPDSVKGRLAEQAKTMSDDDWSARLEELSALTGVKPEEAAADGQGSGAEFTHEETSRTHAGTGGGQGTGSVSREAASTVVGGLLRTLGPPRKEPAGSQKT